MNVRIANMSDFDLLKIYDIHVTREVLERKIIDGTIIVAFEDDMFVGWLRFNYFWDEHPFMNMLFVLDEYRNHGYGIKLVKYWEELMFERGFSLCMVSTMSNETSQEFYRKLGYKDIGGFVLEGEPMELIMSKTLTNIKL